MGSTQDVLQKLESVLSNINAPILDILQPGIDRNLIDNLISELDLSFKMEVYELYAWRNGTMDTKRKIIGAMTLFTNGIFYSLEQSIDVYKYNALENAHWNRNYFPLFSSGGGDYLLMDLGKGKFEGAIFLYSPALLYSSTPLTIYDSLEMLLLSVLECYQQKAYDFIDGILETDIDMEFSICKKNNPHSKYWEDS